MADRVLKLSMNFCEIDYTLLIFKCINFPDTFCVNTVIKAYASCSLPTKAVGFYFEMLEEDGVLFKPNSFTFPSMISSCTKTKDPNLGQKCHGQAVKVGVDRTLQVENALIHMYSGCGLNNTAWKVFDEMSIRDLVSWNSIVDGYVKSNNMEASHKLFDKMPVRNVVSWNAMMKGYLDAKNPGLVLKLFRKMVKTDVNMNATSAVTILTACGRSCRLKEGKSVHGALIRMSMDVTLIIGTSLIDMYSKNKRPDIANIIFNTILTKNIVCWNAMISGESIHGNPKHALQLFDKMLKPPNNDITPDEVTYIGVLCACTRESMLEEGQNHFLEMTKRFNINPSFAHYWCMASLYANHGLVKEAVEFLKNMPVDVGLSPQSSLWAGLLGSCRFNDDVATGEQIAKALIEDDPLNNSYHGLLMIMYAVGGRWEDVTKMKCMMEERGVSVPGFSLVELTEIVHSLKAEDYNISMLHKYG
ncbi:hypothetical protein LXL04_031965 [Taraxacum kok-saghyz]